MVYYFWGLHCCWTGTSIVAHDFQVSIALNSFTPFPRPTATPAYLCNSLAPPGSSILLSMHCIISFVLYNAVHWIKQELNCNKTKIIVHINKPHFVMITMRTTCGTQSLWHVGDFPKDIWIYPFVDHHHDLFQKITYLHEIYFSTNMDKYFFLYIKRMGIISLKRHIVNFNIFLFK